MPFSERTPLLWDYNSGQLPQFEDRREHRQLAQASNRNLGEDVHAQFCALVGCRPSNAPPDYKHQTSNKSLYGRATRLLRAQNRTYLASAGISNTLLLIQVILGAALTGLGASGAPSWVITLFGATNTVIAGVVAYLKSRGQPMRARVFRDDLERVVDEIENSEIMWLGISQGVHGYDDIDTDGEVTVRSEVARLTRLYDRAVRTNTMNNPDMYMAGGQDGSGGSGLRNRGFGPQMVNVAVPAAAPEAGADAAASAPAPTVPAAEEVDQSPASARIKPKEEAKKDDGTAKKAESSSDDKGKASETAGAATSPSASTSTPAATTTTPAPAPAPAPTPASNPNLLDDDSSPATRVKVSKKSESSDTPKKVSGDGDDD